MKNRKLSLFPILLLCAVTPGIAAPIALFDFNASDATTNFADFADKAGTTGVTVGNLTPGAGLPFNATNPVFSGNSTYSDGIWLFTGGSGNQGSFNSSYSLSIPAGTTTAAFADAVAAGDMLSFTVTPDIGYTVSLESFTFQASGNNNNDYPNQIAIRIGTDIIGSTTLTRAGTSPYTFQTIDLSPFNFSSASPFTVDIIVYGAGTAGAQTRNLQLDDLTLNGIVAIPEPATVGLIMASMMAGLLLFRRRRNNAV